MLKIPRSPLFICFFSLALFIQGEDTGPQLGLPAAEQVGVHYPFGIGVEMRYNQSEMPIQSFQIGSSAAALEDSSLVLSEHESNDTYLMIQADWQPWKFLRLFGSGGFQSSRTKAKLTTPDLSFKIPVDLSFTIPQSDIENEISDILGEATDPLIGEIFGPILGEIIGPVYVPVNFDIPVEIPARTFEVANEYTGPVYSLGMGLGWDWEHFFVNAEASYQRADLDGTLALGDARYETWQSSAKFGQIFVSKDRSYSVRTWFGLQFLETDAKVKGSIPIEYISPELAEILVPEVHYEVRSKTKEPWTTLIGIGCTLGARWYMELEGGLGGQEQIRVTVNTRF